MAGRSIEDARTAQRAVTGKAPCLDTSSTKPSVPVTTSAKVASSDTGTPTVQALSTGSAPDSVVIGGITYYPNIAASTACIALTPSAHIETLSIDSDDSGTSTPYSY
jgi:hypothetical protein